MTREALPPHPMHWTRKFRRWVGVPVFALYTLAVHTWTVAIAYAGGGKGEAVWVALTPLWSWFRLAYTITTATGTWANAYTSSVVLWSVCGVMMVLAGRLNRGE